MPHDTLSDLEKVECETKLFALMAIEARGDPPPIPSPHHKKGHKRFVKYLMSHNQNFCGRLV